MAIAMLHRIQHFLCLILVFLLQFSLLLFPSLGYNVPDKYFINCGSDSNVTVGDKVYVGESNPVAHFSRSKTESNESQVPSPLYQTARIFRRESSYEFGIDTNGIYLVRLHFFSFTSRSNLYSARFNISVPGFWLVQKFDARNDTENNANPVKEFFMKLTSPSFKIIFRPLPSSFAFVNAIELFLLPPNLISNNVSRFTYRVSKPDLTHYTPGLYSSVLETKPRLNVGGQIVTDPDNLLRKWFPDDTYLANPENAKNRSPYPDRIEYHGGDDSDGPNANKFTAPSIVYGTAKEINNSSACAENITWALPVDNNTDHLLRLHFCDYLDLQIGLTYFSLSIYDTYVMPVNIYYQYMSKKLPAPYYYDFVVHSDDSGFMKVSIAPNASAPIPNAFLNGLEIMKIIERSSSV